MKNITSLLLASLLTMGIVAPTIAKNPQTLTASQLPDFSPLLSQDQNDVIGAIGTNYQRLYMTLKTVKKTGVNTYQVTGISKVKSNSTPFTGTMTLKQITLVSIDEKKADGVDAEYIEGGSVRQGNTIFDYVLNENKNVKNSGQFKGMMTINWYQTKDGMLHYDDLTSFEDGYDNRIYKGVWTEYATGKSKPAVWADYRLSDDVAPLLDFGTGEFMPNEKYCQYGWQDFSNCKMRK